jgi:pimeloyl-ACP methyl ester carboxylesterase
LLAAVAVFTPSRSAVALAEPSAEAVVLLHGLGRSERAMRPLARSLEQAGYKVCNLGYASRSEAPDMLVAALDAGIRDCASGSAKLHFVGHSLGGILSRAYIAKAAPANLGRVVLLAPPNRGSEYVDLLADSEFFRWLLGPTWAELGTGDMSLPRRLPPPAYECGVIAGTWSFLNPFAGWVLEGDNDGLVTVESTKLDGMADFLAVRRSHTFIMRADEVAAAIIRFLDTGKFK